MSLKSLKLCHALMLAGVMSASVAAPTQGARTYIVQLKSAPAATYTGSVAGLAATQVPEGERLKADAPHVKAYRSHLQKEQQAVLATVGAPVKVLHRYDLVFNGFAALLTPAQVKKLQASGQVRAVVPDEVREATTVSTPHFLGLDIAGGVWSQFRKGALDKGEDVIVAVVDSGIQPESPAFYDRVDADGTPVKTGGTLAYGPPPAKWAGSCTTGAGFPADACNNKLIGAKVFSAGFLAAKPPNAFAYNFYDVPRDEGGHGTHTLSTAGGNAGAPAVTGVGNLIGSTSGIAPRARVASYKALFGVIDLNRALSGSGYNSDLVAAIEQAVADGVDVINYSVSGSQTNLLDPVEMAFFDASAAGVFVAASAGNSGPANQVAHPSPWLTTVAASTHDRSMVADLGLGDGSSYTGASFNGTALPATAMVLSSDIAAQGVPQSNANLCLLNSLDSAKAAGKVVVCDRGTNARVEKSAEVKRVGGVGMVLINPSANTLVADFHSVPTVHLPNTQRTAVRSYVSAGGATGGLGKAYQATGVIAPVMAGFSSRGPNLADDNVMKPEITAPGVDVIASVAFIQTSQADHNGILNGTLVPNPVVDSYQGTSMSSPHIAGVAALVKQAHPSWSPAAIKSAIVTTATGVKLSNGTADTDLYGYGAGHVNPNGAVDPGLIYESGPVDHYRFLCGAGWVSPAESNCTSLGMMEPGNLNLPTFSVEVAATTTVKRAVKNVGGSAATYTATASVPGFDVVVSPSTLSLADGEKGNYTVTLTANGAPADTRVFGTLTWSDGVHNVTSPVQARSISIGAPGLLSSTAASGNLHFRTTYGFAGATSTVVEGLKPANRSAGTVAVGNSTCFSVEAPADTLALRAALYDADTSGQGQDDLDLEVYDSAGNLVASSGGATATELVTLSLPGADTYQACVVGYAPQGGSSDFTLSTWVLSAGDTGGSLKVKGLPTAVTGGDEYKLLASWSGLTAGTRYLGGLRYLQGDGSTAGATLLAVEPSAMAVTGRGSEMTAAKVRKLQAR
jgi:subtilisin family serine protease